VRQLRGAHSGSLIWVKRSRDRQAHAAIVAHLGLTPSPETGDGPGPPIMPLNGGGPGLRVLRYAEL
jgi:hypothetical protein